MRCTWTQRSAQSLTQHFHPEKKHYRYTFEIQIVHYSGDLNSEHSIWDGEFHPCPNQPISSATKSEPPDKPPQLIKASFTLYKDYDIFPIAFLFFAHKSIINKSGSGKKFLAFFVIVYCSFLFDTIFMLRKSKRDTDKS